MKMFKKIAAVLSAAVVAVSVGVTASAVHISKTAKEITSGKSVSATLKEYGDTADYMLKVSESGTLKFSIESHMYMLSVTVFDSDDNKVVTGAVKTTKGNGDDLNDKVHIMTWNESDEVYKGTVSYSVKPGTYYVRFSKGFDGGSGKFKFTATYPTSDETVKFNYITINLERGDKLSLDADITGNGKVTWKSSKSSVASISSTGKVTAKAKGTAVITAKCGDVTKKIKIKVS